MRCEHEWLQWPSINISSAESGNIESVLDCWVVFLGAFAEIPTDSAGGSGDLLASEVRQEGQIYASFSGISAPMYQVSRNLCKVLAEVEQASEVRREDLRTRHTQTFAESLPPLSADILEPIQHVRASTFRFPLFEPSIPVPALDVFLSLLCLLIVAFPVLQLFFADLEPSGSIRRSLP